MENKTSYTLQEAKEAIALKNNDQFSSWQSIRSNASCTVFEILSDEAAELYKSKATEELRKENEVLNTRINKYRENFHAANYARNEAQIKYYRLSDEIERLKESNKELVDLVCQIKHKLYARDTADEVWSSISKALTDAGYPYEPKD